MACTLHQGPGVFFLFAAFILLVIVSVSTPVWDSIYFLKAQVGSTRLTLGSWGFCQTVNGLRTCTSKSLGYEADDALRIFGESGSVSGAVAKGLTYALVLHPIAAGITLFALIISLTTNWCLDIFGSLFSFLAFIVALVAFIIDSILFVVAKSRINRDVAGSPASLSNAYWMTLAAVIALLLASFTVCCGSLRDRKRKRRDESATANNSAMGTGYGQQPVMHEKKWWQRNKY